MRLLVVEDEHSLREDIARKLRLSGYEVDACADGEAALEALAAERYDLVLLDLNLPKVDGMQVLRTLRRHDLETCVLILSARSEISTYLTVVSSVTVHTTRESAPSTNSSVTLPMPPLPATSALVTYMGLVPISPYTTPSVTSIAEMLTGIAACEAASLAFCSISRFPPNFNVRRDYRQSAHVLMHCFPS